MIEIYEDSGGEVTLISARGTETLSGFWVESAFRDDDIKGNMRRTIEGDLRSWSVYKKYHDTVSMINMQKDTVEAFRAIIHNEQVVYYAPDPVNRADEIYKVMIDLSFSPEYNPLTKRYTMVIEVLEV